MKGLKENYRIRYTALLTGPCKKRRSAVLLLGLQFDRHPSPVSPPRRRQPHGLLTAACSARQ
jgi:hypothetical protein